jgi:hypothetical protein
MRVNWYALACVIASALATASFLFGFCYFGGNAVFSGQWLPFFMFMLAGCSAHVMYWLDRVATEKERGVD